MYMVIKTFSQNKIVDKALENERRIGWKMAEEKGPTNFLFKRQRKTI